jgi:hypothetical protein
MTSCSKHPAVGSFSTSSIEEFLMQAVQQKKKHNPHDVCLADYMALLQVPAAQQLSAQTVATLLQHAVQELGNNGFMASNVQQELMALQAVQQLPADAIADILAAAARAGNAAAVSTLCALPVAQQLNKDKAKGLRLLALQHGQFRVVQQLQELPQLQDSKQHQLQPTSEQLHQLLSVAINSCDSEAVVLLCQLAASQAATRLEPQAMQQLLIKAMRSCIDWKRYITDEAAEQVFLMRDAQAISAAAAAELLYECVSERSAADMLRVVALLPAVQHISQQDAENLLLAAIKVKEARELCALLQFSAVQQLQPEAVVRLLTAGYKSRSCLCSSFSSCTSS